MNDQNKRLPNELLTMIMYRALPPRILVDSGKDAGSDPPWCQTLRTKKAFTLVCKYWWAAGMQLLYEDITFHRVGQIAAFIYALDHSPFAIAQTVRSVDVRCILQSHCIGVFESDLTHVLKRCPRIHTLGYRPLYEDEDAYYEEDSLYLPFDLMPHLAHLDLWESLISPAELFGEMATTAYKRLESLSFDAWDGYDLEGEFLRGLREVQLPSLRSLCVYSPDSEALDVITSFWCLPNLRRVMFLRVPETFLPGHRAAQSDRLCNFLHKYGGNIEFLQITRAVRVDYAAVPVLSAWPAPLRTENGARYDDHEESWDVARVVSLCPSLLHIAGLAPSVQPLKHSRLEWIDLPVVPYSEAIGDSKVLDVMTALARQTIPSLKRVRVVETALLYANRPGLPYMIPPRAPGDALTDCEYRFPGVAIKNGTHALAQIDELDADDCDEDSVDMVTWRWPPAILRDVETKLVPASERCMHTFILGCPVCGPLVEEAGEDEGRFNDEEDDESEESEDIDYEHEVYSEDSDMALELNHTDEDGIDHETLLARFRSSHAE